MPDTRCSALLTVAIFLVMLFMSPCKRSPIYNMRYDTMPVPNLHLPSASMYRYDDRQTSWASRASGFLPDSNRVRLASHIPSISQIEDADANRPNSAPITNSIIYCSNYYERPLNESDATKVGTSLLLLKIEPSKTLKWRTVNLRTEYLQGEAINDGSRENQVKMPSCIKTCFFASCWLAVNPRPRKS